ncbi:MAG TPA: hypothetical protein VGD58_05205 [Herpetosiphonaceae bacterium]
MLHIRFAPATLSLFVGTLILFSLDTQALHAQAPTLQFLENTPLSFTITDTPTVFIQNKSSEELALSFRAVVYDDEGRSQPLDVTVSPNSQIAAFTTQAYTFKFTLPDSPTLTSGAGFIEVAPPAESGIGHGVRQLTLSPEPVPFFENMLTLPLKLASLVVIIVFFVLLATRHLSPSFDMLGASGWDFKNSWASTTTIGTVFLNAALLALLPQKNNAAIAALGAVFAIFVIIAPFIYNTFTRQVGQQIQGNSSVYLISCLFTLWGVFGSLCIGSILVSKVSWQSVINDPLIAYITWLPRVLIAMTFVYAGITMFLNVKKQTGAATAEQGKREQANLTIEELKKDILAKSAA